MKKFCLSGSSGNTALMSRHHYPPFIVPPQFSLRISEGETFLKGNNNYFVAPLLRRRRIILRLKANSSFRELEEHKNKAMISTVDYKLKDF